MTLQQKIENKIAACKQHFEQMPGAVIIHHLPEQRIVYMSQSGLDMLGVTMQQLASMNIEQRRYFTNEEEAKNYGPKVHAMLQRNDDNEVVSFFQQIRPLTEVDWQWVMCSMRIFMRDDEGAPLLTVTIISRVDMQHKVSKELKHEREEKKFRRQREALFASLTPREKEIVRLIAMGKNGAAIADECSLSVDTVKTHRRNIKRKLHIETTYDIVRFVHALEMR